MGRIASRPAGPGPTRRQAGPLSACLSLSSVCLSRGGWRFWLCWGGRRKDSPPSRPLPFSCAPVSTTRFNHAETTVRLHVALCVFHRGCARFVHLGKGRVCVQREVGWQNTNGKASPSGRRGRPAGPGRRLLRGSSPDPPPFQRSSIQGLEAASQPNSAILGPSQGKVIRAGGRAFFP